MQNARRMQSTGKVAISREPGESLVPLSPLPLLRHLRAGSRKRRNEEVGSSGAERRGEKETSRKAVSHRAEREERRMARRRVKAPGEVTHRPRPLTPPHTLITRSRGRDTL